jgi:hypothetical protein
LNLDKIVNRLTDKLNELEDGVETNESELMETKFAQQRSEYVEKARLEGKTDYYNISYTSEEEILYRKKQYLKTPPEERYQIYKKAWYFHHSSWYMRGADRSDGMGCHNGKCDPGCRFYQNAGRIEDNECLDIL